MGYGNPRHEGADRRPWHRAFSKVSARLPQSRGESVEELLSLLIRRTGFGAMRHATLLPFFALWDFVYINDADGLRCVTPFAFISESFGENVSRHLSRGCVFTDDRSSRCLSGH